MCSSYSDICSYRASSRDGSAGAAAPFAPTHAEIASAAASSSCVVRFNPVSYALEAAPSDHQSVQSPRQVGSSSPWRERSTSPNAAGVVSSMRGVRPAAFHSATKSRHPRSGGPLSTRIGCVDST